MSRMDNEGIGANAVSLVASLRNDLFGLPPEIAESPLAVLALVLAAKIDSGDRVPDCSRELRQCLAELKLTAGGVRGNSALDQLQAKRDQRRNA